jgi:hypothetical protein
LREALQTVPEQIASPRPWRQGKAESEPLTLDQAHAAKVRIIVWYKACRYQTKPDVAELVAHHGTKTTVIDWEARLVCSQCGARHQADFVISGAVRSAF